MFSLLMLFIINLIVAPNHDFLYWGLSVQDSIIWIKSIHLTSMSVNFVLFKVNFIFVFNFFQRL